ncbi:glycosyltransferase [Kosakonia sp.]|uniref:glycosyltransferase n=1 Tax=Kosakonia sp. TaxID=1916651 RepID=UPI0028A12B1E|nr:glycosyltransferase [Kosakonia sp.]
MKKILFVSAFHPGANGKIGAGEAICGDSLRRFVEQGYQVDVVVNSPTSQCENEELTKLCNSYNVIAADKISYFTSIISNIEKMSFLAPWFYTRVSGKLISIVNGMLEKNEYDIVWLDFPSVLGLANHIKHKNIHYFAHDVVFQRIARTHLKKMIFPFVRAHETRLFSKVHAIVAMSEKDKQLIRETNFQGDISVVELGKQRVGQVFNNTAIEDVVKLFENKNNLVFFGNMQRSENHWSIVWFILFVFPQIIKKKKDVHLWVLGLAPRMTLRLLGAFRKNIHVVGPVSDPTLAFQKAELNIAPLLYGAGVKIKVLQILDAGANVVATPVGAEGVKNCDKLYVVDKKEFGSKILELLDAK